MLKRLCSTGTALALVVLLFAACSNLTGWRIPGTEKSAGPVTTIYLVCENVESIPEGIRSHGEIYVDGAFFSLTNNPTYYRFVGNALVIGRVRTEKEKEHTIRVTMPGYEPFERTRYYGTLPEYSLSFRVRREGVDITGSETGTPSSETSRSTESPLK